MSLTVDPKNVLTGEYTFKPSTSVLNHLMNANRVIIHSEDVLAISKFNPEQVALLKKAIHQIATTSVVKL